MCLCFRRDGEGGVAIQIHANLSLTVFCPTPCIPPHSGKTLTGGGRGGGVL